MFLYKFKTADAAAPTFTLLVSKFYFKNAKIGKSSKIDNNRMEMMYEIAKVLLCQNWFVYSLKGFYKKNWERQVWQELQDW